MYFVYSDLLIKILLVLVYNVLLVIYCWYTALLYQGYHIVLLFLYWLRYFILSMLLVLYCWFIWCCFFNLLPFVMYCWSLCIAVILYCSSALLYIKSCGTWLNCMLFDSLGWLCNYFLEIIELFYAISMLGLFIVIFWFKLHRYEFCWFALLFSFIVCTIPYKYRCMHCLCALYCISSNCCFALKFLKLSLFSFLFTIIIPKFVLILSSYFFNSYWLY